LSGSGLPIRSVITPLCTLAFFPPKWNKVAPMAWYARDKGVSCHRVIRLIWRVNRYLVRLSFEVVYAEELEIKSVFQDYSVGVDSDWFCGLIEGYWWACLMFTGPDLSSCPNYHSRHEKRIARAHGLPELHIRHFGRPNLCGIKP